MTFTLYNHLYGLLGSFATIITLIYIHKNAIDAGKSKVSMKQFLGKKWDDFAYLTVIAQVVIFIQEYAINAYAEYKDKPEAWDFYFNNEELISFLVGLFGMWIFIKIFKLGRARIEDETL